MRFGIDMYSLNAQNWTPFQQLDFAAKWKAKVVHFSEIRFLGTLEPDNLRRVRARADELRLDLEIGMRSICPTSAMFDKAQGTAEEQLAKMIDAAKIVRSPIVRAVLGSSADRKRRHRPSHRRDGQGAEEHAVARARRRDQDRHREPCRRHAGPRAQASHRRGRLRRRGVCLDSGNPVWTIEDPHLTLDTLAPYVLTSHMRDSALWNTPEGAAVRWTRMGEGNMGMESYIRTYIEKCPGRAVSLEVIVTPQPRMFNYRNPEFWELYRSTPAWEFARFLAICDKGKPSLEPPADPAVTPAARQLANVEASIRWTQAFLARM